MSCVEVSGESIVMVLFRAMMLAVGARRGINPTAMVTKAAEAA